MLFCMSPLELYKFVFNRKVADLSDIFKLLLPLFDLHTFLGRLPTDNRTLQPVCLFVRSSHKDAQPTMIDRRYLTA